MTRQKGGDKATTDVEDGRAGAAMSSAPATIPPAALDSLRKYAAKKGLDDVWLEEKAGKPLAELTEAESHELTTAVTGYRGVS